MKKTNRRKKSFKIGFKKHITKQTDKNKTRKPSIVFLLFSSLLFHSFPSAAHAVTHESFAMAFSKDFRTKLSPRETRTEDQGQGTCERRRR
jgi:hypothetical protein